MTLYEILPLQMCVALATIGAIQGWQIGSHWFGPVGGVICGAIGVICGGVFGFRLMNWYQDLRLEHGNKKRKRMSSETLRKKLRTWNEWKTWRCGDMLQELTERGEEIHSTLPKLLEYTQTAVGHDNYVMKQTMSYFFPELVELCFDDTSLPEPSATEEGIATFYRVAEEVYELAQRLEGIGTEKALAPLLEAFRDEAQMATQGLPLQAALRATLRRAQLSHKEKDKIVQELLADGQAYPHTRAYLWKVVAEHSTQGTLEALQAHQSQHEQTLTKAEKQRLQKAIKELTERLDYEAEGGLSLAAPDPLNGQLSLNAPTPEAGHLSPTDKT